MGDMPYTPGDYLLLPEQIQLHNEQSPSSFMIHLGDIKGGAIPCLNQIYNSVGDMLKVLLVPTFIIVGDNEWNDCSNPDEAWDFWLATFDQFHENWPDAPTVETQPARPQNFAWVEQGVLIMGLTMPGGATHSEAEWASFLADGAEWTTSHLDSAGPEVYAAVLFVHANPSAKHDPFMVPFREAAQTFARPLLFLHGDGHVWIEDQPWPETNIYRVQVDQGSNADPLQVTVDPEAANMSETFVFDRDPF
jgi:hypothetical protein